MFDLKRVEHCLLAGPLPDQISDGALRDYFSEFGDIVDVEIPSRRRGLAHIYFFDTESLDNVLGDGRGHVVDGIPIRVRRAQETGGGGAGAGDASDGELWEPVNHVSAWQAAQRANAGAPPPRQAERVNRPSGGPASRVQQKPGSVSLEVGEVDTDDEDDELQRALRASLALSLSAPATEAAVCWADCEIPPDEVRPAAPAATPVPADPSYGGVGGAGTYAPHLLPQASASGRRSPAPAPAPAAAAPASGKSCAEQASGGGGKAEEEGLDAEQRELLALLLCPGP
jgi:hypothetical protein